MIQRFSSFACAVAALLAAPLVFAQAYPSKPIRVIVPFAAGASNDIVARLIAPRLSEGLGQTVIVDNRPGAGGILAGELVARANPDGYTLLMGSPGPLTVNPLLFPKLSYQPGRDFAPVSLVSSVPMILLVNPSLPAKSVQELITLARSKPGALSYASTGTGTVPHLSAELFKLLAKVDLVHVPYKGSSPAVTDLIGGQIVVFFDNMASALPHVKTERVRALAITTPRRSPLLPELRTMIEAGVPGFDSSSWNGLVMPARTPAGAIDRFHAELVKVLKASDIRERLDGLGAETVGNTPAEFASFMENETRKWGRVVREANIKAE
jgi:tripartite-type tricarboxylate transporter receptor subunit TctC